MAIQVSTLQTVLVIVGSAVLVTAVHVFLDFRRAAANFQNHPGFRVAFSYAGFWGNFLPRIRGVTMGENHSMKNKHSFYAQAGWDVLTVVSGVPNVQTWIRVADAAAIKEITSARHRFPKPVENYEVLNFFGHNIVASEGEEWKKIRKIVAPAFSDRNNKLVWDETLLIMEDMFQNAWGDQDEIVLDHCVSITLQIALSVVSVAGFGRRVSWKEDQSVPAGHTMTFKNALHIVSQNTLLKIAVPEWAMGLTKRTRDINAAFGELEKYMMDLIQARKTGEEREERYDLFSSLLDANDEESGESGDVKLTTQELLGNVFIFQLAGHETTAHTLCFVFGLLALYQDEQEILFQHIKSLMPDGRIPTYADMPLFTYSMAVFYETLRLYPATPNYAKMTHADTVLNISNAAGERKQLPVPAGTKISIDVPGVHYNPRYWDDPHAFRPARFLGDYPRDAFLPFSAGARACLGRKFFETEGIAVMTMLVSRYKIAVKEEPRFAGETFEQRKARVLRSRAALTLTPIRVPLVFKRR